MDKRNKPGKPRRANGRTVCLAWTFMALGMLTLAGCSSQPNHKEDPLIGVFPKDQNGQPLVPANPGQKAAYVLPPPAANSATSVAALAGNPGLSGSRPLAINEKSGPNWTLTNTTSAGNPTAPRSTGPTVQPLPRDPAVPAVPMVSANTNTSPGIVPTGSWTTPSDPRASAPVEQPVPPLGAAVPQSVDDLQKALQARGAGGLTQEALPGGVRVSCLVPNPTNPNSLRFLETTGPDAATALRALLQQIESQR